MAKFYLLTALINGAGDLSEYPSIKLFFFPEPQWPQNVDGVDVYIYQKLYAISGAPKRSPGKSGTGFGI